MKNNFSSLAKKNIMAMVTLTVLLFCAFTPSAQPATPCPVRVATKEEPYVNQGKGIKLKDLQMAWIRNPLVVIDELIKKNNHFTSISNARLRNTFFVGIYNDGIDKISGQLNAFAYSRKGWDAKCGIIPEADRIAANEGFIGFSLNNIEFDYVGSAEYCPYKDDKMPAFFEPIPAGTIAGNTYYTNQPYRNQIVLTCNKKPCYVPVLLSEYLDYVERTINKRKEKFIQSKAERTTPTYNEEEVRKTYETYKKTDTKLAAEYLQNMQAMKKEMEESNKELAKLDAEGEAEFTAELEEFKKFCASLSAHELKMPAYVGAGKYNLYTPNESARKKMLVKIASDFIPYLTDKKIKIITITYTTLTNQPGWAEAIDKTIKSMDFNTIENLMKSL